MDVAERRIMTTPPLQKLLRTGFRGQPVLEHREELPGPLAGTPVREPRRGADRTAGPSASAAGRTADDPLHNVPVPEHPLCAVRGRIPASRCTAQAPRWCSTQI